MRAAVFLAPGVVEVRDVVRPSLRPGEVLVRVRACGICGTDVHGCRSGLIAPGCVMGHEYAGRVEAVGEGVGSVRPADLVAGNSVLPCGACARCREGASNLCEDLRILGINTDGALAEAVAVPERTLVRVPDGCGDELALAEPLSIAVRAREAAALRPGDGCLITGAGPIGLLLLLLAKREGAEPVLVAEVRPARAALAARLGADRVLDPSRESLVAATRRGVAALLECSGAPAALEQAPSLVRPGGRIVPVGLCEEPVPTDYLTLVSAEIQVRPVYLNTPEDFAAAVLLIASGAVDVRPLISDVVGLDDVPHVLDDLAEGSGERGGAAKVLVRPGRASCSQPCRDRKVNS